MPTVADVYSSSLNAEMLKGMLEEEGVSRIRALISDAQVKVVGEGTADAKKKTVLSLRRLDGRELQDLILNVTNARELASGFNEPDFERWLSWVVELRVEAVQFGAKRVNSIDA